MTPRWVDQDSPQEECQEGNPVLFDGVRCQRNRYALEIKPSCDRQLSPTDRPFTPGTGRTTFVNTLCGKQVLEGKDADDAANAHIEEGVRIKPVTVGESTLTSTGWKIADQEC